MTRQKLQEHAAVLGLCLSCALIWNIIGKAAFDITLLETLKATTMFVAAFYFGRWVKRNME